MLRNVTEKENIVHPSNSSLSLCLFYGILNALSTASLKNAFCGGEIEAEKIMSMTSQLKTKTRY